MKLDPDITALRIRSPPHQTFSRGAVGPTFVPCTTATRTERLSVPVYGKLRVRPYSRLDTIIIGPTSIDGRVADKAYSEALHIQAEDLPTWEQYDHNPNRRKA